MQRHGFTRLEMVIVITLVTIVVGTVFLPLSSLKGGQELSVISHDVFRTIALARHRAQTREQNLAWGVKILSDSYVLFAGNTYQTRDASFDVSQNFSNNFTFSGTSEINFLQSTGEVLNAGTIIITNTQNTTARISVNSAGVINLE